jgi:alpha-L-arabinofuranosidase
MFFDATRDSRAGVVCVKVVNRGSAAYPVRIHVAGMAAIETSGETFVMKGDEPQDTNSITNPETVKPVTIKVWLEHRFHTRVSTVLCDHGSDEGQIEVAIDGSPTLAPAAR